MKKSDAEIQQAVLRELKWDTRVHETDVGVSVASGIVTLTGTLGSWAQRTAATAAAHRVHGVLDVANDISVRLPGSIGHTDAEVARAVRDALEADVMVPHDSIKTTVARGMVTLEGEVEYASQREDAERAISHLAGVRGVTNALAIRPKSVPGDVKQAIDEALERRARREALQLQIDVHEGCVTVTGVVHTRAEKEVVLGAARGTAGVRSVEDRLAIEPD